MRFFNILQQIFEFIDAFIARITANGFLRNLLGCKRLTFAQSITCLRPVHLSTHVLRLKLRPQTVEVGQIRVLRQTQQTFRWKIQRSIHFIGALPLHILKIQQQTSSLPIFSLIGSYHLLIQTVYFLFKTERIHRFRPLQPFHIQHLLQGAKGTGCQQMIPVVMIVFTRLSRHRPRNITAGRRCQKQKRIGQSCLHMATHLHGKLTGSPFTDIVRRSFPFNVRPPAQLPIVIISEISIILCQ